MANSSPGAASSTASLFEILEPEDVSSALVFNSPHSGSLYPPSFLEQTRLGLDKLRRAEDNFVDELFIGVVERGAPLLRAHFPRSFIDVNREPYELDPRMFEGKLPGFANTRSVRVAGGLGTVPRIVGENQDIYAGRLPVDEALFRIARYHRPYHAALRHLLTRTQSRFGFSILLDCHSMPSISVARDPNPRADFVLGDRYGTSCNPVIIDLFEAEARKLGYVVIRNKPYAGGFITEHYGHPNTDQHALQIEINRALYIDEATLAPNPGFEPLKADLMTITEALMAIEAGDLHAQRRAAE
ncbi:MAG: N-formylglutamate amidohydrolase [Beijerinckiaceae bacterium]|nr:N-formylglutamate amidohydrolase [Beijerinckiaceae bacterium]